MSAKCERNLRKPLRAAMLTEAALRRQEARGERQEEKKKAQNNGFKSLGKTVTLLKPLNSFIEKKVLTETQSKLTNPCCKPPKTFLGLPRASRLLPLASCLLPLALTVPVQALQVKITPAKPQLGDTLSVVVEDDKQALSSSPSVTMNQKTYKTFEIAPNTFRALMPTTPLEKAGNRQIQVKGGGEVKNLLVSVRDRTFPVQRITLPPGKAGLDATKHELDRVAAFKQLVTPKKFWNGSFLKPNRGAITTIYGVRRYYNGKFANDYYHRGVDYAGAVGSPVIAPASGRIALVGRVSQGFRIHGNIVGIDHGQGVTTAYLHLSRIDVQEGDFVQAGQVIGAVGATGAVTGPHLHWGLYVQGQSVDPVPWRNNKLN